MKEWKVATLALGIFLVVIGLVSRSYEVLFVNHWWPSVSILRFKWVFSYLDLFGIGILLYSAERAARFAIGELKLFVAVLSVLVALVILSAISFWAKRSGVDWQNAHDPVFMIVALLFTCIAFAMVLGSTGLSRLKDLPVFTGNGCSGSGRFPTPCICTTLEFCLPSTGCWIR
jgi:peptidoglycan/LPS O-acetylase OafA/YrhL